MMMQGIGQSKKVDSGVETTFPIRKEQLKDFTITHRDMADFYNMYADKDRKYNKTILVGNNTGDMYLFFNKLGEITDKAELENYCTQFSVDNDLKADGSDSDNKKEERDSSATESTTTEDLTDSSVSDTEAETSETGTTQVDGTEHDE